MKLIHQIILTLALVTAVNTAHAQLQTRTGGMVYDSDLNITWVADANLFKTLADQSGNPAAYVQSIITANNGIIHSTPSSYDNNTGVYPLSADDFYLDSGRMTWFGATAWVNSLNYGGYSDWRLPATVPAVYGFDITASEFGHLFYSGLGNTAHNPIADSTLFSNQQSNAYWSSTILDFLTNDAWFFDMSNGYQDNGANRGGHYYAWAVRTGDVAAVPLPSAGWLLVSGLVAMLRLQRRKF